MRKLESFTPPKPISEPFGAGSGQAHTFFVTRDGCVEITETDHGSIEILAERNGKRVGFVFPVGGGYARMLASEVEQPKKKEKAEP